MYQRKNNKEKKKGKQSFPKGTVITDSFLFNVKKVVCTESRLADRLRIHAEVLSWADLSFCRHTFKTVHSKHCIRREKPHGSFAQDPRTQVTMVKLTLQGQQELYLTASFKNGELAL